MTSFISSQFNRSYWGRLSLFELPYDIVKDGKLVLTPRSLAILLVLLQSAKASQSKDNRFDIEIKITQETLKRRSGLSKNTITKAVCELEEQKFIKRINTRTEHKEFGANVYLICNPTNGQALAALGNNFYLKNNVRYIRIPTCIVKDSFASWSLAEMESSEIRGYVVLCWLANEHRDHQFKTSQTELKKIARFSSAATLQTALDGLEHKGLVLLTPVEGSKGLHIHLLDPYTGEPLQNETGDPAADPANYFTKDEKGRETRLNLNIGNPEYLERLVCDCLPEGSRTSKQKNGNLLICCPFHHDTAPSCSVSFIKRCFHCFGCNHSGTITELVMKLRNTSKGEVIQLMGQELLGHTPEYRMPDKNVEAKYSYRDKMGNLIKEVLRYPGKKFSQRRPAHGGGWIWDTGGVKPLLYNLFQLQWAGTACLCEGEKDCDTLMKLELRTPHRGDIVATTSGGADSWHDELADDLIYKKVILMPDNDEAGEKFRDAVITSLKKRNIEYRVVSFEDTGAKDVTEYIEKGHTEAELAERIGTDWVNNSTVVSNIRDREGHAELDDEEMVSI